MLIIEMDILYLEIIIIKVARDPLHVIWNQEAFASFHPLVVNIIVNRVFVGKPNVSGPIISSFSLLLLGHLK